LKRGIKDQTTKETKLSEADAKLEEYKSLKKEKRKLQILLHEFQNNFVEKTSRKVSTKEDRKPIQKEYDRYQVLLL
jgi:hypothetical protein